VKISKVIDESLVRLTVKSHHTRIKNNKLTP